MTTYRRKLIETALPLEAINAASKRDKDRKTGTVRNLHKWFAPMPLPAMRALIFAALVDDPLDAVSRKRLLELVEAIMSSSPDELDPDLVRQARDEIVASGAGDITVLDPFCGGGSTLIEAQRLGLSAVGSDLNPIPVLISKLLTELAPGVAGLRPISSDSRQLEIDWDGLSGLLIDVERYGEAVREIAHAKLARNYPPSPNGDPVIAWRWATTVESPDPRFRGFHTPIVQSWWLSRKPGHEQYLNPIIDRARKSIRYEVADGGEPVPADRKCLFSGAPISFDYLKTQGAKGRLGRELIACISDGKRGRVHFAPTEVQIEAAKIPDPIVSTHDLGLPDQALGFRYQLYGFRRWSQLFTDRQRLAIATFAEAVAGVPELVKSDGGSVLQAEAITSFLALCIGRMAQVNSALVTWRTRLGQSKAESAFGQHVVPMVWDFAETNPFADSVGDWMQIIRNSSRAFKYVSSSGPPATVVQRDARSTDPSLHGKCLVVTDPPYFSAIGYANLSDYFYPWIRLAMRNVDPELFATLASPKDGELISEPARHGSQEEAKQYFVEGFTEVFRSQSTASRLDVPIVVIYAYKEQVSKNAGSISEGWEAMLEAILRSGLGIEATWPIHGTGSTRMRSQKSNALATYVALVCRPLSYRERSTDRRTFISELRLKLRRAVAEMTEAQIAPVDLAQAVIGPGMSVYSRSGSVVAADGSAMSVREALHEINNALSEILDGQESDYDAGTRWAASWFGEHGFGWGSSGEADALARAKVTSIGDLVGSGILEARAGRARLVPRGERLADYSPEVDATPTVWEALQFLTWAHQEGGDLQAATAMSQIGQVGTVRELCYHMFSICERQGWSEEGRAYNALAASWRDIAAMRADLSRFEQGRFET